jgi:hypothetical protein
LVASGLGQERGEIRSDIDPEVKAVEIVAFAMGMETQWLLTPNAIDRQEVHESFARALIEDLTRPDAPRRVSEKKATTRSEGTRKLSNALTAAQPPLNSSKRARAPKIAPRD